MGWILGIAVAWGVARNYVAKKWGDVKDNPWAKSAAESFVSPWKAFESVEGESKHWSFMKLFARLLSYWTGLAMVIGLIWGRQFGETFLFITCACGAGAQAGGSFLLPKLLTAVSWIFSLCRGG